MRKRRTSSSRTRPSGATHCARCWKPPQTGPDADPVEGAVHDAAVAGADVRAVAAVHRRRLEVEVDAVEVAAGVPERAVPRVVGRAVVGDGLRLRAVGGLDAGVRRGRSARRSARSTGGSSAGRSGRWSAAGRRSRRRRGRSPAGRPCRCRASSAPPRAGRSSKVRRSPGASSSTHHETRGHAGDGVELRRSGGAATRRRPSPTRRRGVCRRGGWRRR